MPAANNMNQRQRKQTAESTVTHLYLHDKFLKQIANGVRLHANLQVLYLHNNELERIEKLEALTGLKHLYLQNNKISRMEGLSALRCLTKLYLGGNRISVVEGVEALRGLEELHVEGQRLASGDSLCFEPRAVAALRHSLRVLNVAHNGLCGLDALEPLRQLRSLDAAHNQLADAQALATRVLRNWLHLTDANFVGNPMVRQHRYRDTLIANTFRLAVLDSKDIHETTRTFVTQFDQNRANFRHTTKTTDKNRTHVISNTGDDNDDPNIYVPWQTVKPKPYLQAVPSARAIAHRPKQPKRVSFAVQSTHILLLQ